MSTQAEWLLENYEPACCRCGRPGADMFEDPGALAAQLAGPASPLQPGQVQVMAPFGIWSIEPGDLEPGRPVHARCQPGKAGRVMRGIAF